MIASELAGTASPSGKISIMKKKRHSNDSGDEKTTEFLSPSSNFRRTTDKRGSTFRPQFVSPGLTINNKKGNYLSPLSLTSRISDENVKTGFPKVLNGDSSKEMDRANFLPTEDDLEQWRRMGDINLNEAGAGLDKTFFRVEHNPDPGQITI